MPKYFRFEVRLLEVEPPIWRKFLIKSTATFQDLHDAIQEAARWWDYHLFLSRAGDDGPVIAGKPDEGDPFGAPEPDAEKVKLDSYFGKRGQRSCQYVYDFGDNWEVEINLVETIQSDEKFFRRLLDGARAFPREDSGGIGGYERYVEIVKTGVDPYGEDVAEAKEWLEGWTPEDFEVAEAKARFDRAS